MVEKIIVNPSEVRGLGNIVMDNHTVSDWETYKSVLGSSTDTVNGESVSIYELSMYGVSFNNASYMSSGSVTVTVTVTNGTPLETGTVYVTGAGTGSASVNFGTGFTATVSVNVTGITASGTLTATYKGSSATVPVTYEQANYTLTFNQSTYTMLSGTTVSCTLKLGNTPVSGEGITFATENNPQTNNTDSNGVATFNVDYFDFYSYPATLTATWEDLTATCTIVE